MAPRGPSPQDLVHLGSIGIARDLLLGLPDPQDLFLPSDERRVVEFDRTVRDLLDWATQLAAAWQAHRDEEVR